MLPVFCFPSSSSTSSLSRSLFIKEGEDGLASPGEVLLALDPPADVRALWKGHSSQRRACGGGSSSSTGEGGEVLEEAEKRKEAAVKNRIKGHEKMQIFFFF